MHTTDTLTRTQVRALRITAWDYANFFLFYQCDTWLETDAVDPDGLKAEVVILEALNSGNVTPWKA